MWIHFLVQVILSDPSQQAEGPFAPFLRNLLWTHKSKGKCHQATSHHVREGIKESELLTPISKRHKLNKKAQLPDMSCSLYT